MKVKRILTFVIIALVIAAVAAPAIFGQSAKPPRTLDQKIFKSIAKLPNYGVYDHISFERNGDTVTLSGKVYSLGTIRAAEQAVKDIDGVGRVVNKIEMLPPSPYDDRIRRSVFRAFAERGLSRYLWEVGPEVRIIVENGRITLEGYVNNSGDRDLAGVIANTIPGVFEVKNNLKLGKDSI
ncbi:MAG: BON domain-containing protein [Acidobacteria bacterium]|nr:BON domain-containing protein [Acidobacteriota bacterium]MCW5949760.1 BON domain-containing protein [Pyrinomonadaceae bacterium]